MLKQNDDFEAMFNEGAAVDGGDVTEDMAAGLDLEDALEDQAEGEAGAAEVDAPAAAAADAAADESTSAASEPPMESGDGVEAAMADASPQTDIEKERQRLKSWEGRLKALDAQLKAREQASEQGMAADGAAPDVEAATVAMETQPIDEVMATLAEDFGDDFVKALTRVIEVRAAEIAGKVADEKVSAVAGNVDQLISSLTDDKARTHFETIADAHPDFMEVAQSNEFKQWLDSLGDKSEQAKAIVSGGSARQVVKLLSEFKAASTGAEQMPDAAMMAAQTVTGRSGMRLPAKPAVADDYEAAWNEFS